MCDKLNDTTIVQENSKTFVVHYVTVKLNLANLLTEKEQNCHV